MTVYELIEWHLEKGAWELVYGNAQEANIYFETASALAPLVAP